MGRLKELEIRVTSKERQNSNTLTQRLVLPRDAFSNSVNKPLTRSTSSARPYAERQAAKTLRQLGK